MNFVWEQIQVTDGQPSEPILIIGRNMMYIDAWCRIHGISPRSPKVRQVFSINDLHGISDMFYVDLGTDDQDIRTLLERLKAIGAIKPLLVPNI